MEKIKNFFSNYKSDILNVLGVVALIAVVVVGAVLFFGRDNAEPDVVEDTTVAIMTKAEETTTEPTTVEPETTTVPETTTKAAVTTTKAPVTTTKAPVTTTKAPSNNTPGNTEEGTLPAGLADDVPGSSYDYEQRLVCYNDDANIVAAYNDALSRGVKPTVRVRKNGTIKTYYETGWAEPYDIVSLCSRCGKPQGGGTHGTCATFFHDATCPMCGANVKGGTCHTCKY